MDARKNSAESETCVVLKLLLTFNFAVFLWMFKRKKNGQHSV